jgi:CheY-like chemotaxis protein
VEYEEIARRAAVEMVSDLGYSALQAADAAQALVILRTTPIDVLLTDVVIPGPASARELARQAQELQPGIKVLFASGYTRNLIAHNVKFDNGSSLSSKPCCREQLAQKLRGLLQARCMERRAHASAVKSETFSPGKVLIVEDSALIRLTTVEMVKETGRETLEASNGLEALALLNHDPEIAILLTDLGLPDMDGRLLIAEAVKLRPQIKVIAATGYSGDLAIVGVAADVIHLAKPFDIHQLRKALEA